MDVIQLPNGNLLVPESALAEDGQLIGDGYVEIGPADAEYDRLAERALTEDQIEERRRRWQEGDAELQRQFAEFRASQGVRGAGRTAVAARPDSDWIGGTRPGPGQVPASPRSSARTSDSRNRRCPPGVRMLLMRPDAAHRVTVFGSTRNRAATSPGVRRRSLLASTHVPS